MLDELFSSCHFQKMLELEKTAGLERRNLLPFRLQRPLTVPPCYASSWEKGKMKGGFGKWKRTSGGVPSLVSLELGFE